MDTKDIAAFVGCYEMRSINRAAKSLFISPQGLGKVLDRLERELGLPLFDRTKQGLIPTEAGVYFYKHGQKMLRLSQSIEVGIKAIRERKKGLRIGYSCGVIRILRARRIENFHEDHPQLSILWEESVNDEVKERLLKQEIDAAFVVGRTASSEMFEKEIFSRGMSAILYEGHPLYDRREITIRDLMGEKLITLNEKYQSYFNLLQCCEHAGFVPEIRVKTMEASLIYRFCHEQMGVGVDVDIHLREMLKTSLRLVPIKDSIPWVVYAVCRKDRTDDPEIRLLLDYFS